jgi:hypothetical protein
MKLLFSFNHIQAERKDAEGLSRDATIEYPVDMYIQQVKRETKNRTTISFRLQTKTNPEFANFALSGDLLLEGTEDEIEVLITPSSKGPPQVWKHIYQEGMNILTVLANIIDLPFPTPRAGGEIAIDNRNFV